MTRKWRLSHGFRAPWLLCALFSASSIVSVAGATRVAAQPASSGSAAVRLDAAVADSFARAARARPLPITKAQRITTAPTIDGVLDEAVWRDGEIVSEFLQRELNEGVPASERTEVRFATDGANLYIGARMFDREPRLIVPGEKIRDVQLANSDYIAFIFDTYHDRQNGFVFATTPAGVEYDGQVIREGEGGGANVAGQNRMQAGAMGGFNVNWDASWTVATRIDSLGWTAEFRIPFSTLRYQTGDDEQSWGLNVSRMIRRKNEELYWSFIPRQFNLYRLSLAGTLANLDVPVRRIQTITPYVLTSSQEQWSNGVKSSRTPSDFGGEIKYGVTPSLTLDLTYNTDFAQVEVDDQRVNLTRFPVFFPEKRPFFLENAGVFSAGTPQAVDLFFSRRIGISNNGTPQPILGGGRLSGRVGKTTVGLLQMVTDAPDEFSDGQSYSVGRVIRELSSRSRVGAMFVQRMSTDSSADVNRTYAVDGRIGIGQAWTGDLWAAITNTPGRSGDENAYSARLAYQTNVWNHSARYAHIGEDFNPEVGFMSRPGGYRTYDVSMMRLVRKPEWAWFRQWNPHASFRGVYGQRDNYYQTGYWHIDLTEIEFANSSRFGPEYNISHEGLQAPFEIAPGVVLPVGQYDWGTLGFDYQTDPSENVWVNGRFDAGGFYTGTRRGGSGTLTVRRGATFSGSLTMEHNDVKLPQGDFKRTLEAVRLNYFFTPRVFVQTLTQFNNQQRIWSANVRFGWLNTAGTGLFVVFNDGREANSFFDWVRPQQRTVFVKFTRQFGTGG
ncbi:MAG: carbohydrate binding family 9 domain-containing protein [Gemmatimonadaceae bacterium]|nr:carbohydrate binding family 9 domain-containing protein [Gemmatimonadaceae bacterium]